MSINKAGLPSTWCPWVQAVSRASSLQSQSGHRSYFKGKEWGYDALLHLLSSASCPQVHALLEFYLLVLLNNSVSSVRLRKGVQCVESDAWFHPHCKEDIHSFRLDHRNSVSYLQNQYNIYLDYGKSHKGMCVHCFLMYSTDLWNITEILARPLWGMKKKRLGIIFSPHELSRLS